VLLCVVVGGHQQFLKSAHKYLHRGAVYCAASSGVLALLPDVVSLFLRCALQVVAIFTGRGGSTAGFVDSVTPESGVVGVILNETSFYYESGGQVYDTGALNVLAGTSVSAAEIMRLRMLRVLLTCASPVT
jgi:hypothetical protein